MALIEIQYHDNDKIFEDKNVLSRLLSDKTNMVIKDDRKKN